LFDGSSAPPHPVELEQAGKPLVFTRFTVVEARALGAGSRGAICVALAGPGADPIGVVEERIGVVGGSVTYRQRRGLMSCDDSAGPREGGRRWCGGSFGRYVRGRLSDPRVDLAGCRTQDGEHVAFAWVEPRRSARYVVLDQREYFEAYEVGADLPVRVASAAGIQYEPLGATFEISEHDASGALLRRYRLKATPAG
jgi:hypothetical protein